MHYINVYCIQTHTHNYIANTTDNSIYYRTSILSHWKIKLQCATHKHTNTQRCEHVINPFNAAREICAFPIHTYTHIPTQTRTYENVHTLNTGIRFKPPPLTPLNNSLSPHFTQFKRVIHANISLNNKKQILHPYYIVYKWICVDCFVNAMQCIWWSMFICTQRCNVNELWAHASFGEFQWNQQTRHCGYCATILH